MRVSTAAFVTAAALSLAGLALAGEGAAVPRSHGPGPRGMSPVMHMLGQLGLSEAQTAQVKAITERYDNGTLGKSMESVHAAQATLHRTIHDVSASESSVREAAETVARIQAQSALEHHRMAIEISAVLTPEQRERLAGMFADMQERHGGHGGAEGL